MREKVLAELQRGGGLIGSGFGGSFQPISDGIKVDIKGRL